jgi:hypothetical protein
LTVRGYTPADYTYRKPGTVFRSGDFSSMRALLAGLIAAAILWAVDVELNGGRYTRVVKQAALSFVGR